MSSVQEIAFDRAGVDYGAGAGRDAADRIQALRETRATLEAIRIAAKTPEVAPAAPSSESAPARDASAPGAPGSLGVPGDPGAQAREDRVALGEVDFQALDLDKDGALSVSEMIRMLPPLPPRDKGPSLADRALEARWLSGVETATRAEAGRDATGLFLERLKAVQAA